MNKQRSCGHLLGETRWCPDCELESEHASRTALTQRPAEPVRAGWLPIETAPKDGTEVLVWRADCGQFIASYTSMDALPLTQEEIDATDEETLFAKDWFTQWPQAIRCDGSEAPTHWMHLPPEPDATHPVPPELQPIPPELAAQPAAPEPQQDEPYFAELLPCPFCGGEDIDVSEGTQASGRPWYYVECAGCAATAEPDHWNKRAATPAGNPPAAVGGDAPTCRTGG